MDGVFVYLIKSWNGSFYTGISKDVHKRLKEHNSGRLRITSRYKPYTLVYFKKYSNYGHARKHEKWLKNKNRQYKEMLAQLAPPARGGVK